MTVSEEKRLLRTFFKERRASLAPIKSILSEKICKNALSLPFLHKAKTVLLYSAVGSEADLSLLFDSLLKMGKRVAFPKCKKNGIMDFYTVTSAHDLSLGMMGILEPSQDLPPVTPALLRENDICFVPALSVDPHGFRLGYGGGYYDRYLSSFPGITATVCFEECISKSLPKDKTDVKTNYIITESRVEKAIEN